MSKKNELGDEQSLLYLKGNVYFEPLINKWYVWPYLLPPISCAMNMSGRYLRLMKSFVNNSQLHINAIKSTNFSGGDFVDCSNEQVDEVKNLIDEVENKYSEYLSIRRALTDINELIEKESGLSLEPLYAKIPEILKGYVELTYDMNQSVSIRLIEGLIYESDLYKIGAQSASFGLLNPGEERAFVLSSPRLPCANNVQIDVPFSDSFLDVVFESRTNPISKIQLNELIKDKKFKGGLDINELFTCESPSQINLPLVSDLRITYLGHAGLLFETKNIAILVDPVIPCRGQNDDSKIVSFSELPKTIDYICVTHTHMDHVCVETLLQLRHKTKNILAPKNSGGNIADPSIKLMLNAIGFNVIEFEEMEEIKFIDGKIKSLPFLGEHADLNIRSKTAWYLEICGKKIFCAADSSSPDEILYQRIHKSIGNIDMIFIGMECVGAPMNWLYGSLFTKPVSRAINESRRFNGSDFASAKKIVEIFNPTQVYIYALGLEPWFKYFMGIEYDEKSVQIQESDKLICYCRESGARAERLFEKKVWSI